LKDDGSLAGWGCDDYGQCDVPDGNDFLAIAGGSQHSLAIIYNCSLTADLSGDCDVDFEDLHMMTTDWLKSASAADIFPPPSGDGIVDFLDFAVLADQWLAGL